MNNLKQSKTIAGLAGLLVVAVLVPSCRDSVGPTHRAPGGPEGWLVEPPPPPPPPSPPVHHPRLVVVLLNHSAVNRVAGCMANPLLPSTIAADVSVDDADPLSPVTAVTVALEENPGGTLCGTTTVSVGADGMAHFTDLGVDFGLLPPACAASTGGCQYTLRATAVGAESGVSDEFTITFVVPT
jgi:hypothetical protein